MLHHPRRRRLAGRHGERRGCRRGSVKTFGTRHPAHRVRGVELARSDRPAPDRVPQRKRKSGWSGTTHDGAVSSLRFRGVPVQDGSLKANRSSTSKPAARLGPGAGRSPSTRPASGPRGTRANAEDRQGQEQRSPVLHDPPPPGSGTPKPAHPLGRRGPRQQDARSGLNPAWSRTAGVSLCPAQ